jgi:hypothetical protein
MLQYPINAKAVGKIIEGRAMVIRETKHKDMVLMKGITKAKSFIWQ